ncbi:MAG: NAD(P)/FAD-dependent oxidoreductase [Victivallales bacterium]|nr:NAD(P)/FAD-dependent oxidoreductase [Victivallales bacterium]
MKETSKIYDVIVFGSGPAGTSAAGKLSAEGNSVLLIDRYKFPREKVCGDGLTGDSIRMLKKFGIWDEVSAEAFRSDKVQLFPFEKYSFTLNVPVYTLKRTVFDSIMRKWAAECGADIGVAEYIGCISRKNNVSKVKVRVPETEDYKFIKGRIVVLAIGCQRNFSYAFSRSKKLNMETKSIAVRGYCKADWNIKNPLIFFDKRFPGGYVWIFPMSDSVYNVGCGAAVKTQRLKSKLNGFLKENQYTSISEPEWLSKPKGAFIQKGLCKLSSAVNNNILLTGETLGSTYPFTGEGIGKAMETGYLTAEFVNETLKKGSIDDLEDYPEFLKDKIGKAYLPYIAAEAVFKRRFIGLAAFILLCSSKGLCNYAADILSERKNPENSKLIKLLYKIIKPLN